FFFCFFFQVEDRIPYLVRSCGVGDVYYIQVYTYYSFSLAPDCASSILAVIFVVLISLFIVKMEAMPMKKNIEGLKTLISGVAINGVYDLIMKVVQTSG
ncbi:hypothetical protein, partial [Exiguobacterium indicum]|uniref:hypothetical protein n=1 Tax=Exiguobacterium indicum TaxID=296995 RepID=UPI000ADA023C